jgi:hypothetical protein
MKAERRFVICTNSATDTGAVNGATVDQRNQITLYLEAKTNWQVWHWFENIWLVVVPPDDEITLAALRGEFESFLGELKHTLIMQVSQPITFTGRANKDGWPWMYKNWGTPQ